MSLITNNVTLPLSFPKHKASVSYICIAAHIKTLPTSSPEVNILDQFKLTVTSHLKCLNSFNETAMN